MSHTTNVHIHLKHAHTYKSHTHWFCLNNSHGHTHTDSQMHTQTEAAAQSHPQETHRNPDLFSDTVPASGRLGARGWEREWFGGRMGAWQKGEYSFLKYTCSLWTTLAFTCGPRLALPGLRESKNHSTCDGWHNYQGHTAWVWTGTR